MRIIEKVPYIEFVINIKKKKKVSELISQQEAREMKVGSFSSKAATSVNSRAIILTKEEADLSIWQGTGRNNPIGYRFRSTPLTSQITGGLIYLHRIRVS